MSTTVDSETAAEDAVINFTFKQRSGVDAPNLPDEISVGVDRTVAEYLSWTVDAALELIYNDSDYDGIDAAELEAALGDTHYVEFDFIDRDLAYGRTLGVTTTTDFRVNRGIDRQNCPFDVDDTIETADGATLTFQDYPTDGLLFETADGWKSQIEAHELFDMVAIEREVSA